MNIQARGSKMQRQLTLAALALLTIAATTTIIITTSNAQATFKANDNEKDSDFWLKAGKRALDKSLRYAPNVRLAKNAILFIGDGMSLTTIAAARILQGQLLNRSGEEDALSFEMFPNVALIKTYNLDQQVPDSAATATAMLCGVKANFYTLGVNGNVQLGDTNCQTTRANHVHSILKHAMDARKATGVVTNTRITHATPAAAYAHSASRKWECDSHLPRSADSTCNKDIARQLIEDEPGSRLNVVLGGGRRCFFGNQTIDPGASGKPGLRADGRNLIDAWIRDKGEHADQFGTNYAFVNSTSALRNVDTERTDHLLGLFSYSHMSYEELRDQSANGEPSLAEMTVTAIKVLSRNPNGFVLIVEGGRIDHSHHENVAGVALRETIALSWAVEAAQRSVDESETLLAVTADHAHALTMNGHAPRGNPILGLSRLPENSTKLPYTTLIYGNGPGHQQPRRDPRAEPNSTDSPYYVQFAAIQQEEAFHDGSDVGVFASGPFAHLFQGVQEQSYIAHVLSYATCIGQYAGAGSHCSQSQTRLDAASRRNHQSMSAGFSRLQPTFGVQATLAALLATAAFALSGSSLSTMQLSR